MSANDFVALFGASVLLPIVIFILAILFGVKAAKAFRSAVCIGIAFVGINAIVGPVVSMVIPAVQGMVAVTGIDLPIADIGWGVSATMSYGTVIGMMIIPIAIAVNVIMILLNWTKTINVDVWNFWHFAFVGSMAYILTGKLWCGIVAAVLIEMFTLVCADWYAPAAQRYFKLEGVSFTVSSIVWVPWVFGLNWLLDRLGFNKIKADPESLQKKFKVFGEGQIVTLIMGLLIGVMAKWHELGSLTAVADILKIAIGLSAFVYIFPKVVSVLMEGLVPLSEGVRAALAKRGVKREIYIGMDTALGIGDPCVISAGVVLIPVILLLAVLVPGNRMLPLADLVPMALFGSVPIVAITRGNVVKTIIIGAVTYGVGLLSATAMAPAFTEALATVGVAGIPSGVVSVFSEGVLFHQWLIILATKHVWAIALTFVVFFAFLYAYKRNTARWNNALIGDNEMPND